MRIFPSIVFYRSGSSAIGISLSQNGVYRAALDTVIARSNGFFLVGLRGIRMIRNVVTARLQLLDRGL